MFWQVLSITVRGVNQNKDRVCAYCIALSDVDAMKIIVGGDEAVNSPHDDRIIYCETIGIETEQLAASALLHIAEMRARQLNKKEQP